MKTITITKAYSVGTIVAEGDEDMEASDGYHTFKELYDHRITLFIALCKQIWRYVSDEAQSMNHKQLWRSEKHFDGEQWDGWFIMGIGKEEGKQITYHLPMSRWDDTDFVTTYVQAPVPFDGHTPADVLERIAKL